MKHANPYMVKTILPLFNCMVINNNVAKVVVHYLYWLYRRNQDALLLRVDGDYNAMNELRIVCKVYPNPEGTIDVAIRLAVPGNSMNQITYLTLSSLWPWVCPSLSSLHVCIFFFS